jgi:hypothetical protein
MKQLIGFLIAAAVFSHSAQAALPPYYQRIAEIERILADQSVQESLRGQPIDRVERIGDDLYRATGGNCSIDVEIVDQDVPRPEGWTGPRQFEVLTHAPVCK